MDQATIDGTDYSIGAITMRLKEWTENFQLVADQEQCDEDGSTCPTGIVIGIENDHVFDEYDDDPTFQFASFDDRYDAERFIQLMKDQAVLLKMLAQQKD